MPQELDRTIGYWIEGLSYQLQALDSSISRIYYLPDQLEDQWQEKTDSLFSQLTCESPSDQEQKYVYPLFDHTHQVKNDLYRINGFISLVSSGSITGLIQTKLHQFMLVKAPVFYGYLKMTLLPDFSFSGVRGFRQFLNQIYTYDFLSWETQTWIESVLQRGSSHQTVILVPVTSSSRVDDIYTSLYYRYPVYYGRPMEEAYRSSQVGKLLSYNPATQVDPERVAQLVYGILGPVEVKGWGRPGSVYVLHSWGLNFETRETQDYLDYMASREGSAAASISQRMTQFFQVILGSIVYLKGIVHSSKVLIRLPPVGLGLFLSALSSSQQAKVLKTFLETLTREVKERVSIGSSLELVLFDQEVLKRPAYDHWLNSSSTQQILSDERLILGLGPQGGDLFRLENWMFSKYEKVVVVNAWDNMSFIGNGGSADQSIDGYMISGRGPDRSFINTSYLHNLFFQETVPEIYWV